MYLRKGLILTLVCGVFVLIGVTKYGAAQETDCGEIMESLKAAEKAYKEARHEQKKAFEEWDKYYKKLHSDTYAGTEEPLVDTMEKCGEGESEPGGFCTRADEDYQDISAKEQEKKKALDEAKQNAAEAGGKVEELKQQAKDGGCE
jgi:peptidoglycan hydrolase CwlO-like protein